MKLTRLALLFVIAVSACCCTQWGTYALRSEVWWACPDRAAKCSSENASLTYISGLFTDAALAPTREALARASAAHQKITNPPSWDDALADYVQAAVDAERKATKLYAKLYR